MTKATFRYVLLIFAIIIVFNWKVLLTSQFTFLAGHEGVSSAYSWYSFWARTVKAGSLPIWDPYTWAGHPFVGEMQTGAFYPLNVLLLLAPLNRNGVFPRWVYDDSFVIAHLLGMLFMFALVREMKMSRFTSLLAAICFSLAGPVNNNMAWPDMAHSAVWLPLIFLFFLRAVRQEETKKVIVNAVLSGLCFGMSILAGRLHLVIMQGIFIVTTAAFYFAHSKWRTRNRSSQQHHWFWAMGVAALIVTVGACAGAVQLLPSHEYSKLSLRFTEAGVLPTLQKIPYDHLPDKLFPNAWVGLLFPFGFNGKMGEVEGWNPYIGVLALFFVLIAVWKTWGNLWTRYFAGLAVVVFLVALGSLSLLHGILYATVPLFYMVREGTRFIYLAQFSLVILAAFGFEFFFDHVESTVLWAPVRRIVRIVSLTSIGVCVTAAIFATVAASINMWVFFSILLLICSCALFLYLLKRPDSKWGRPLVVMLVLFDLSGFNWTPRSKLEIGRDNSDYWQKMMDCRGVVTFLESLPGPYRAQIVASDPPDIGDVYGVPITVSFVATMLTGFDPFLTSPALLNARYVLKPASTSDPGAIYQDGQWKVYENSSAYPHAWLVHRTIVERSVEKIAAHVRSMDLNFRDVALLEAPLGNTIPVGPGGEQGRVDFSSYQPNEISMSVKASGPALLVVSEMYYPGWRATVNGQPAEIHKANGALRALVVPGGESRVVMQYRPSSIYLGGMITMLMFIGGLGFVGYEKRASRNRQPSDVTPMTVRFS